MVSTRHFGCGVLTVAAFTSWALSSAAAPMPASRAQTDRMAGDGTAPVLQRIEHAYYTRDLSGAGAALEEIAESEALARAWGLWRVATLHPIHDVRRSVKRINEARRKPLLDEAQAILDEHLAQSPDSPYALLILSQVHQARITGMMSGMRHGRRAGELLEQAVTSGPENPHVIYHQGITDLMAPGPFGDRDAARRRLREAVAMFESASDDEPFAWGYAEALAYLGLALARDDDEARAEEYYERALQIEPGYVWVRDELLPDLR